MTREGRTIHRYTYQERMMTSLFFHGGVFEVQYLMNYTVSLCKHTVPHVYHYARIVQLVLKRSIVLQIFSLLNLNDNYVSHDYETIE